MQWTPAIKYLTLARDPVPNRSSESEQAHVLHTSK